MKETIIVSGFPGVGKTTLFENPGSLKLADSDSSEFSWEGDPANKVRNSNWPRNYMDHIQELKAKCELDIIFVSTHQEVRDALVASGIEFTLVYPEPEIEQEYIKRYIDRGNKADFVLLLQKNYKSWIEGLQKQPNCNHVTLGPGQFLSTVLPQIVGIELI
jgi:hypothetical protein